MTLLFQYVIYIKTLQSSLSLEELCNYNTKTKLDLTKLFYYSKSKDLGNHSTSQQHDFNANIQRFLLRTNYLLYFFTKNAFFFIHNQTLRISNKDFHYKESNISKEKRKPFISYIFI